MSSNTDTFKHEKGIGKAFNEGRELGGKRLDALVEMHSKNYSPGEMEKIQEKSKAMTSQVISIIKSTKGYNLFESVSFYTGYFTGRYFPFI